SLSDLPRVRCHRFRRRSRQELQLEAGSAATRVLTVIPRDGETAEISAGSVDLDGPFIERVNTGAVRIRSIPDEPGLAVCATVPAGARVRVFHDRLPIGGF